MREGHTTIQSLPSRGKRPTNSIFDNRHRVFDLQHGLGKLKSRRRFLAGPLDRPPANVQFRDMEDVEPHQDERFSQPD
ncbi:hypothetical protein Trydic_g11283 [Trypoxylus dichotomus]